LIVTVTTIGWSPAPFNAVGIVKSTVYTPGSVRVGTDVAIADCEPIRTLI